MNALIYSISIIIIYVGLGFLVTVTLGSDALNELYNFYFYFFLNFAVNFF